MKDCKCSDSRPEIVFSTYSPFYAVNVKTLINSDGTPCETKKVTALCRCGHSKAKPYCDGTHSAKGFSGEKSDDRIEDRTKEYVGRDVTIIDNRGVCCHDGSCVNLLPSVFRKNERPWINADGDALAKIIKTIEKCPSGALSYKIGNRRYQDIEREPSIVVVKGGPYQVTGGIDLKDDADSKPESCEHYTLCRCGESKNKPFCDGAHGESDFDS